MYNLRPLRLDITPINQMSPVPLMPVDIDTVKYHCRIDDSDSIDELIRIYLSAAIQWAEGTTDRTIVARTHRWVLREFPCDLYQEIVLPRGRTLSVESVQYSVNGSLVMMTGPSSSPAGTDYQEDLQNLGGGVLMPKRGTSWPSVDLDVPAPVIINFTAGYTAATTPEDIKHALMFAVSDCFDIPGSSDVNQALFSQGKHLDMREMLISGHRLHRIY